MRVARPEHHEPDLVFIRDVAGRVGRDVHRTEVRALRALGAHELHHLSVHVGLGQMLGALLREPRHARLRGEPVARPIRVEVGGLVREVPERIAEHRRRLAGLRAAELDALVLEPRVCRARRGR